MRSIVVVIYYFRNSNSTSNSNSSSNIGIDLHFCGRLAGCAPNRVDSDVGQCFCYCHVFGGTVSDGYVVRHILCTPKSDLRWSHEGHWWGDHL